MEIKPLTAEDLTGETERKQLIQQGRREVVEWVEKHFWSVLPLRLMQGTRVEWKIQLEKWGL